MTGDGGRRVVDPCRPVPDRSERLEVPDEVLDQLVPNRHARRPVRRRRGEPGRSEPARETAGPE
ncbi:hypothetical protein [Plantactinospora sp. BB1]|uniref:hypothetical protein n=1 Tax=Plantactinospora sp. BB1 TaxID=2071627 RepID=UPI000D15AC28|nr:hypothetical protein [Plantactinospora sp. BB1]AVT37405.1 hypothetical protein C6W10_14055 [Plantactinospora sp. BB1]